METGDIFESLLDGTEYVVKNIVNNMAVLHSKWGDKQIITEVDTLEIEALYRKKENEYNEHEKRTTDLENRKKLSSF